MTYDVIGIGIPYVDRIVQIPFNIIDVIRDMSGKSDARNLLICQQLADQYGVVEICGGPISNTLTGMAALGARCGHIGVLGDDAAGQAAKQNLAARKIDQLYHSNENLHTPIVYAFVSPDGERHLAGFPNHAGKISNRNLPDTLDAKIIFCHLRYLGRENLIPVFLPLFEQAKANGSKIVFGLQSFKRSNSYTPDLMELAHDFADIVIGNEEEVEEFIIAQQERSRAMIVRTLGDNGVDIIRNGNTQNFATEKLDSIIDAIGAGDQFAAGFLYGVLNDWELDKSAALGAKTARDILQIRGGQPPVGRDWAKLFLP